MVFGSNAQPPHESEEQAVSSKERFLRLLTVLVLFVTFWLIYYGW